MAYTRTTWVNNNTPALNATNLNKIEEGIYRASEGAVNVMDHGAVADGVTDDAPAIRDAISEAGASDARKVIFPHGVYVCNSSLVQATMLPEGLTFEAVGRQGGNDNVDGTVIRYTGMDICWDVRAPDNSSAEIGQWTWDGFTFHATQDGATMFSFNDVTIEASDSPAVGQSSYIREVAFKGCSFWGPGTAAVTGNGIQALKAFELTTDEHCQFRGFKRAVYLKGCDNCTVAGRFILNVRHIMLTRSGTFGNDTVIKARFLGQTINNGVETARKLDLRAFNTHVYPANFEYGSPAAIYHNGSCLVVYSPNFNYRAEDVTPNNGIVHLGPNSAEVVIYSPQTTGGQGVMIYDTPTTWYWGGNNQLHKLIVHSPSARFERGCLTPHPRLKVHSEYEPTFGVSANLGAAGVSVSQQILTPLNLERSTHIGGFNYITDVVEDANGFRGWAVVLGTDSRSWVGRLLVGRDVLEGQTVTIRVRYRQDALPASGSLRWGTEKNRVTQSNEALANSTSYVANSGSYILSGFANGDILQAGVYSTADQDTYVSSILLEVS